MRVVVLLVMMVVSGVAAVVAGIRIVGDFIRVRVGMKVQPAVAVLVEVKVHPAIPETAQHIQAQRNHHHSRGQFQGAGYSRRQGATEPYQETGHRGQGGRMPDPPDGRDPSRLFEG